MKYCVMNLLGKKFKKKEKKKKEEETRLRVNQYRIEDAT